jgi:WD40 repeat protein
MWPRWLVPRFSIRTLLLAVAAIGVGLWSYLYLPDILRNRQDRLSRAAIDPYELSIAGNGDPANAPPELVAILGDSRLKHWNLVWDVEVGVGGTIVSRGADERVCIWDSVSGKCKRTMEATAIGVGGKGTRAFFAEPAGQIVVWDLVAEAPLRRLSPSERNIERIVANGDGTVIAIQYGNRGNEQISTVEVWNVDQSQRLQEIPVTNPASECLAINPSGDAVAFGTIGQ